MPGPLKVDLAHLRMSADHMDMHHGDLHETHTAAHASIEDHAVEWVGTSALALQAKLAEWQAATAHIKNECAHHRDAFHQIADLYQTVDEDGAIDILRTRQQPPTL